MAKQINIAYEIDDSDLAKSITAATEEIPDVKVVEWYAGMAEKGGLAVKTPPDIIILQDHPDREDIFPKLKTLKQEFPDAAVFVVSDDKRPQHIVQVMKTGAAEYLVAPVDKNHLKNCIEETRLKLANSGKIARGSMYAFLSCKGGLGSTVIAANTATALAQKKSAACLLDMSFQSGDASVLLDIVPNTTIADVCKNIHRLDVSFLRGSMIHHPTGLDFLAAPLNPEDCEEIEADHISRILDLTKKIYDHVIVDCTSMHVDESTVAALKLADKIFLITDLSVPAVRNTARMSQFLQKLGVNPQKVEVTVNRFIKGGSLSIEEVEKTLKKRAFWLFPNDFAEIVTSINRGTPLVKEQPGSPFAKNVFDFVDKLTNPRADKEYRGVRGVFGKAI